MDGSYCVKPLKQKQVVTIGSSSFLPSFLPCPLPPPLQFFPFEDTSKPNFPSLAAVFFHSFLPSLQVDGVSYLLQEIYGIENKYNSQESKARISLAAK